MASPVNTVVKQTLPGIVKEKFQAVGKAFVQEFTPSEAVGGKTKVTSRITSFFRGLFCGPTAFFTIAKIAAFALVTLGAIVAAAATFTFAPWLGVIAIAIGLTLWISTVIAGHEHRENIEKLKKLTEDLDKASEQVKTLQGALAGQITALEIAQKMGNNLKQAIAELEEKNGQAQEGILNLRKTAAEQSQAIQKLTEGRQALLEQLQEAQTKETKARAEIALLKKENKELEARLKEAEFNFQQQIGITAAKENEIKRLQEAHDQAKQELAAKQGELNQTQSAVQAQKDLLATQREELQQLQQTGQASEMDIASLRTSILSTEAQLQQLQGTVAEKEKTISGLQVSLQEKTDVLTKAQQAAEELKQKVAEAEKVLSLFPEDVISSLREKMQKEAIEVINAQRRIIANLQQQVEVLTRTGDENALLIADAIKKTRDLEAKEREIAALNQAIEGKAEGHQRALAGMQEKVVELSADLFELTTAIEGALETAKLQDSVLEQHKQTIEGAHELSKSLLNRLMIGGSNSGYFRELLSSMATGAAVAAWGGVVGVGAGALLGAIVPTSLRFLSWLRGSSPEATQKTTEAPGQLSRTLQDALKRVAERRAAAHTRAEEMKAQSAQSASRVAPPSSTLPSQSALIGTSPAAVAEKKEPPEADEDDDIFVDARDTPKPLPSNPPTPAPVEERQPATSVPVEMVSVASTVRGSYSVRGDLNQKLGLLADIQVTGVPEGYVREEFVAQNEKLSQGNRTGCLLDALYYIQNPGTLGGTVGRGAALEFATGVANLLAEKLPQGTTRLEFDFSADNPAGPRKVTITPHTAVGAQTPIIYPSA